MSGTGFDAHQGKLPESVMKVQRAAEAFWRLAGGLEAEDVECFVLYPQIGSPAENALMKIGGVPPGIDDEAWPKAKGKIYEYIGEELGMDLDDLACKEQVPMEHLMTLDLTLLDSRPRGVPADAVALALFVAHPAAGIPTWLIEESDPLSSDDVYRIVYLAREQVERGVVKKGKVPTYTDIVPTPLGAVPVRVPRAMGWLSVIESMIQDVQDSKDRKQFSSALFHCFSGPYYDRRQWIELAPAHLRQLFERLLEESPPRAAAVIRAMAEFQNRLFEVSYLGGVPIYVQDGEVEDPTFVAQFGQDLFDEERVGFMNFADMGAVYVFSDRADLQSH